VNTPRNTVRAWKHALGRFSSPVLWRAPPSRQRPIRIRSGRGRRLAHWRRVSLEPKIRHPKHIMLETIAIILLILWLLGLVSSYTMGGFIHLLLVVAIRPNKASNRAGHSAVQRVPVRCRTAPATDHAATWRTRVSGFLEKIDKLHMKE
jgi:hypothetical protein